MPVEDLVPDVPTNGSHGATSPTKSRAAQLLKALLSVLPYGMIAPLIFLPFVWEDPWAFFPIIGLMVVAWGALAPIRWLPPLTALLGGFWLWKLLAPSCVIRHEGGGLCLALAPAVTFVPFTLAAALGALLGTVYVRMRRRAKRKGDGLDAATTAGRR